MNKQTKILLVEDSPTTLEYLANLIAEDRNLLVIGRAMDGREAVHLTRTLRPDVIAMDVHMPNMNGFEAVFEIMRVRPTPIVVMTNSVEASVLYNAFNALNAGALAVVRKPPFPNHPHYAVEKAEFLATLRRVDGIALKTAPIAPPRIQTSSLISPMMDSLPPTSEIIGIAASIGGPSALAEILSALPDNFPVPMVIWQQLSNGFDRGLVAWLQQMCHLQVKLAEVGDVPRPGEVLIIPAGISLRFSSARTVILEPVGDVSPADILFDSIRQVYGAAGIGLVLTGAGQDGSLGLAELHRVGGLTIAQDQSSCVLPDMPFAALQRNAITQVIPVGKIARFLSRLVTQQQLGAART